MSSNIQAPPIPVILLGWSLVIGCGDPTGLSEDTDAILISTRRTTFLVDEFVNFTDVHVIRLDRLDELVNITDDGLSLGAEWSPDGSRIAFRSRRDYGRVDLSLLDPSGQVFVMDSDGRNARNLRNDTHEGRDRSIAWSPEGSEVAFEREGELCVADIRGRGVRCLTDGFAPRR